MKYNLEDIDLNNQERVLRDAGEEKVRFLRMRGGHFNNNPGLSWAVDDDRSSYLLWAPQKPMESRYFYYFFWLGRMYSIVLDSESSATVEILENDSNSCSRIFRDSLREAFAVYGVYGKAGGRSLKINYKSEE